MKKLSKAITSLTGDGMFLSQSSSDHESDNDKHHLPTADDLIFSDDDNQPAVVIRRNVIRLKRQRGTISLQMPLSIQNTSSLESIIDGDNQTELVSESTTKQTSLPIDNDPNRTSFNESERTDSGIGRDSSSSWRLSNCSELVQQQQPVDKQPELDETDNLSSFSIKNTLSLFSIDHSNSEDNGTPLKIDSVEDEFRLKKAGWLYVKHWLTVQRHHHKIELASKRQWKRFWTCLKGSTLQLFNDYSDQNPKSILNIVESLCYPLPEHPHRQHVFNLTTSTGDTYCFQSTDQSESDHWIRCIHRRCRISTEDLLQQTIIEFDEKIERENKMRKLGELQLKASTSQKVRLLISKQIDLWEKNLEIFHVDRFRTKCYLCALTNDQDLPNPKDLLAQACPTTKATLHKLAAFTPCSFYACIAARRRPDRYRTKLRLMNNGNRGDEEQETKCYLVESQNPIVSMQQSITTTTTTADQTILQMVTCESNPQMRTIVSICETATVGELLKRVTDKLGLQIDDYFLLFDSTSIQTFVPNRNEKLNTLTYSSIEIRRKIVYQITLNSPLHLSGIEIDTELYREYSLQVSVANVQNESEGERLGVIKGDEIVIVNNWIVQELDLDTLDRYLNKAPVMLTIRSSRSTPSSDDTNRTMNFSHAIIQNLICPPPPRRIERLSRRELRELIVPKPDSSSCPIDKVSPSVMKNPINDDQSPSALERLLKNVDELSRYCRPTTTMFETGIDQTNTFNQVPRIKTLSNAQRIRKVIFELIETERSYVQDMQRLLERYIEPLRDDNQLLPADPIESLYASVKSIHQLQHSFLERLESNLPTEVLAYNAVQEFRDILIGISETFLAYAQHFKLYSTFCAMHLRINRLLDAHQNNTHLRDFLAARNPRHQHSSSFESYLIKPVQRILKYPLLLQQMYIFCNDSQEFNNETVPEKIKLMQAITMMNEIGEYMNAMQQLYEDFGQSFEQMSKTYSEERNKTLQLNLPDLYAYGEIDWLNIHLFLLVKSQQRLKTFCFVFRNGCLLLVREQSNKKKPDLLSSHKVNKIIGRDRFVRFLPMEELQVQSMDNDDKETIRTWQLIQTDPKTRLKTHFRLANKDALTFVKTINNCISTIRTNQTGVEWRRNPCERTIPMVRISVPCTSTLSKEQTPPQRMSSSRSCHALLPLASSNHQSDTNSVNNRRSPSPIWKRRTTPIRRQPPASANRRRLMRNSTDC